MVSFAMFALVVVSFAGAMGLPPLGAKDLPSGSAADAAETKSGQQTLQESTLAKNATKTSNAASKSPVRGLKKEDLRYDAKSFTEWQTYLKTELKAERRIEGFKAMAAFGRRGYGEAAARTIVELARDYDVTSRDTDSKVIEEAAKALRLIGSPAVPVLVEALEHAASLEDTKEVLALAPGGDDDDQETEH